jgi:hypothetical protein
VCGDKPGSVTPILPPDPILRCQDQTGKLAVRPIQDGLLVGTEHGAYHRGLEVVRYDYTRDASEALESVHVASQPGVDLLIEDELGVVEATVRQREHENPSLPHYPLRRVKAHPRVTKVHLRDLSSRGRDRDRDVLRLRPLVLSEAYTETLDRRKASGVVLFVRPKEVEDGGWPGACLQHRLDLGLPKFDGCATSRG